MRNKIRYHSKQEAKKLSSESETMFLSQQNNVFLPAKQCFSVFACLSLVPHVLIARASRAYRSRLMRLSLVPRLLIARSPFAYRLVVSLLLMLVLGVNTVWGQAKSAPTPKVENGIYYITHPFDNKTWYLWRSVVTNSSTGQNYLTTFNGTSAPAVSGKYEAHGSEYCHWIVKNVTVGDNIYIQLINAKTGKYVIRRYKTSKKDRDVWLDGLPTGDNISYSYFNLVNNSSPYLISYPGSTTHTLNSASSDQPGIGSGSSNPRGQQLTDQRAGLVQLYENSPTWTFTPDLLLGPAISFNAVEGSYTITTVLGQDEDGAVNDGFVIRYTTDGSDPVTNPNSTAQNYGGSAIAVVHDNTTVKAVVMFENIQLTEVAEQVVYSAKPDTPTFEVTCDSKLELSTNISTATLYYTYTTDGSDPADPTNSSTEWTAPVSIPDGAKVKAIAYNGSSPSDVSAIYTFIHNTASPTISLTETTATIEFGSGVTIHYTTDGTDPDPADEGVSTSPFVITGLDFNTDVDIRVVATSEGRGNSCPVTMKKRPRRPSMATEKECGGSTRTLSLTFNNTQVGRTYWYALTNGKDQSAPALNTFTEYIPGSSVDITGISSWNGTDIYVTLHGYTKDADGNVSAIRSFNYMLKYTEEPTITHSTNSTNTSVTITAVEGATIHYSIDDGAEQTANTSVTFTVSNDQKHDIIATAQLGEEGESCETVHTIVKGQTITTLADLKAMTLNGAYALGADIDTGGDYTTIGTAENPFTGLFDGAGYTISGLTQPLFGTTHDATIHDVNLKSVNISKAGNVGAIVCDAKGYTRIYNCGILPTTADFPAGTHSSVTATGNGGCAGGLVGKLEDDSRVVNCFSYADVASSGSAAGIVGNNTFASDASVTDGKYSKLKTMVVNCMFYGNITASSIYPVYGGTKISNTGANAINNYNFYSVGCTFTGTFKYYYCSWPAQLDYLTRYEYHRNLLNSNRELCGWWVGAHQAPSRMATSDVQSVPKDASLMRKWVLDPAVAPYPILKPFGYYTSPINIDADATWRITAKEWEGKNLGTIGVTIDPGDHASGVTTTAPIPFTITDMDTLRADYCYRKIQLPYYNKVFGDPNGLTWNDKYAGNYGEYVVTGWDIITTNGAEGTFKEDWRDGYNFADRNSSKKDKNRTFAQGGYYYVPNDVSAITIKAHWAKAVYLDNTDHSYDRVNMSASKPDPSPGVHFAPAGTRPALGNGQTIQTGTIASNIPSGGNVYENAIVLVGNYQYRTGAADVKGSSSSDGCTIMSTDLDFDNEPDHCLIWQLGDKVARQSFCPIRFDFLPVEEIGLAMKEDGSTQYYSLGCYRPLGHFEVTETSLIHFGQFEFSNVSRDATAVAPIILNGGIFDQYTKGTNNNAVKTATDPINYVIIGGHVRMPSFTPGAHVNSNANFKTRHCAVNVLGGNIDYLYLTGNYNDNVTPNTDNPHCYIDGGRFKQIAAAGKEGINGDVYFNINHSKIWEFYGGSTLANQKVTGDINVTIDNSIVTKYCGGPKFGDMKLDANDPTKNKKVTTNANNTIFTDYYGGGNGGTCYVQYDKTDGEQKMSSYSWESTGKLNDYSPGSYRDKTTGYMANYEMEIVNVSTGTNANNAVPRTYFYAAQFSATYTGPITNNLTNCKVLKNFYGGGNLGGVKGDVTSTLTNTEVQGSAFGAGFSASVPEVTIHNKDKTKPTININTGIITPTPEGSGTYTTYTWTNKTSLGGQTLSPQSPTVTNVGGKNYFYTEESLEDLGTVTGDVTLNIAGTTRIFGKIFDENGNEIAENVDRGGVFGGGNSSDVTGTTNVVMTGGTVEGSVYGGANLAKVTGDTHVTVSGGVVGKANAPKYEALVGNVYGGGKGKDDDKMAGLVTGSTTVTISGNAESPFLYHNVYGGGAYGSVGEFDYDATTGMPTARKANTTGGTANVTITGGKIGTTGQNNGMVFGSSRGDVTTPVNGVDPNDVLAWVYDTHVVIGDVATGTINGGTGKVVDYPLIKGSVYGSGENGHTFHDTEVKVHSGTIGIVSGEEITYNGIKYAGPRYLFRGNVYGGGCGTDTYETTDAQNKKKTYYNFNAGIVKGNANVIIDGGYIVHNVYGGGAMGSVGTFNAFADADYVAAKKADHKDAALGMPIGYITGTGKCTIAISGGKIGVPGVQMEAGGGPDDYGHVFGAGRGDVGDPDDYPNLEICAYYGETDVTISGSALVIGGVYGGSESGHVVHNTLVKIQGGQIGCGEGLTEAYTEDDWNMESPAVLKPTNHWTYVDDGAPYDQYADENGNYANNVSAEGGRRKATDGHSFYGNVFAGGSGYYPYAQGKWLFSAGRIAGNAEVQITGGHILNNVYGGCEMSDVWGNAIITMSGGTVGVPRSKQNILYNPTLGHVYGAGMGDKRIFFNQVTNVENSIVTVSGGKVYGSVHGGGEDGHVLDKATTTISGNVVIGSVKDGSTSGFDGNVFGGGQGSPTALTAGTVGGNVELNIEGGTMYGSIYGGGRIASVGTFFELTTIPDPNDPTKTIPNPNYGKMQEGTGHGYITVNLKGGMIWHNVYGGCMGTVNESAAVEQNRFAVSKNVTVNLNKDVEDDAKGCIVRGNIFGCNNVNSSPQEDVTVHVYATQSMDADRITNPTEGEQNAKVKERFDVNAVYGGGNMAHYKPNGGKATTYSTHVIIDGCDRTSIRQVYGGGNAATTPATEVTVNGTFEIDELFGGGNGADQITYNEGATMLDNPGANVGFYDYSAEEDVYNTKEKRTTDAELSATFISKYVYGSGTAAVNVFGGLIHHVFGGSNTKGNVRKTAITLLEEKKSSGETPLCSFQVDDVYGGGKSAPMDADAKLLMSCIPGLRVAYGGAEAADIQGGVTLTITNGRFDRVFGGNNISGTIRGPIEVNIEETGCKPIIIGELYGGGNLAGYSVYGYNSDGSLIESGTTPLYKDPVVNVKSFTSIGSVYGGGYGSTATMVGNPIVNINVAEGTHKTTVIGENEKTYSDDDGKPIPSHASGKIGAINNVFGGGNEAKVIGNTQVNIGTTTYEYTLVNEEMTVGTTDVSNYYTRAGSGTTEDPYVYTKCDVDSKAAADTFYYVQHPVVGADIRGNVYGGGNNAEVTGNTNVMIGKTND